MVGNVGWGEMNTWVNFYDDVMGFNQLVSFDDKDISTEYTALMSKVMANSNLYIKFPINEPAKGRKNRRLKNTLTFIREEVFSMWRWQPMISSKPYQLRDRGVEFLRVPDTYYDILLNGLGRSMKIWLT